MSVLSPRSSDFAPYLFDLGFPENTPYVHFEQPCFDFMLPLKGETWLVHGVWFRLVIKAFEHVNDSGRVRIGSYQ